MISSSSHHELELDLIGDEGIRSRPYKDSKGILTIGIGHNLVAEGLCAEAMMVQLKYDIKTKAVDPLFKSLPWVADAPDVIQRVLLNMCFQMGITGLLKFHGTLAAAREGRYQDMIEHMLDSKWAREDSPNRAKRLVKLVQTMIQ